MLNPFLHLIRLRLTVKTLGTFFPLLLTVGALAQETASADSKRLQEAYRQRAAGFQFRLDDPNSTRLGTADSPVMTWTSLGGWSGDVFVWTGKGRIQVVGCIGSHKLDDGRFQFFQEFHSLADEPMKTLALDDSQKWRPESVKPKPLTGAPPPAQTNSQRLVQMRKLARTFSFGMKVSDDQLEQEMRLLPQPVARISNDSGAVQDSALFAFVSSAGTDPEVFLLLETRLVDEELVWTHIVARFTTREIWLSRDDAAVMTLPATDYQDWQGPQIVAPYFYRTETM